MEETEACWWALSNAMEAIREKVLTVADLLLAYEKLRVAQELETAAEVEERLYREAIELKGQEEYESRMVGRKAGNLPLWMWDGIEP